MLSLLGDKTPRLLRITAGIAKNSATNQLPRGERLNRALVALGPIFVKLGQTLSTRRDMLPADVADSLALLQDRVPPFPDAIAAQIVRDTFGKPAGEIFAQFEASPVASASIAQVHFATLHTGQSVAVKILRPGVHAQIDQDVRLMHRLAAWVAKHGGDDGRRLRPVEVVNEFDHILHDELDLIREAANASQLRRNFPQGTHRGDLLYVPEIYWDYCRKNIMVLERVKGIPINRTDELVAAGMDLKRLSREGVEIFFTQVFTDGYFHADMHPGNIMVGTEGKQFNRYLALDFGIMGTLSDVDKHYLAQNFLAFFRRDYKAVAQLHLDSGWVPVGTRVDELEAAVRGCCEPFFDKPIKDISLGLVLMRLFDTSRRFNVSIQPQLVLLQKTLLNTEGLGRMLDPELDLWDTAQPILERWMSEQIGWRAITKTLKDEAPRWGQLLPQLPRMLHAALKAQATPQVSENALLADFLKAQATEQKATRRWLKRLTWLGIVVLLLQIILFVVWLTPGSGAGEYY